ncbi:MAG: Lar protein [Thermoproteota archaeon]|nr:Lar protein [Thermoproteota archaeon]
MIKLDVNSSAWYGDKKIHLTFPKAWNVEKCLMNGHNEKSLSQEELHDRFEQPIGTKPLQELARGKKECVVIVDDLTRPTKAYQVIPEVLEELHKGGLGDSQIRFVMGSGAHHFMLLDDLVKKLGPSIPDKYRVFNHNIYENNISLGETSFGTPVSVNREVMKCDLKIAIGGIIPHRNAGFGGGGKLILPGVASIETIAHNHSQVCNGRGEGRISNNESRLDMEESARMAGLDFVVNCIFNADRDWSELVAGDLVEAHRAGVRIARQNYLTKIVKEADIAIVNGYPMESEAYKVFSTAIESVREGGDVIVLLHTPEGSRGHYYNGCFGSDFGGRGWSPEVYLKKPWKMNRVIVVSPWHSLADESYFGVGSLWVKSWNQALDLLLEKHDEFGKTKVAVYPYATLQISEKIASYT